MTCRDVGPGVGGDRVGAARSGAGATRTQRSAGPGPRAPGEAAHPGARQGSDVLISAGHFGEGAGSACSVIDAVRICEALAPDAVASLTVERVTTTRSIAWPRS